MAFPAVETLMRKWRGVPQWQRAADECECILEDREETFAAPDMPQEPPFGAKISNEVKRQVKPAVLTCFGTTSDVTNFQTDL